MGQGEMWERLHDMEKAQGVIERDVQGLTKGQDAIWQAVENLRESTSKMKSGQAVMQALIGIGQAIATAAITAWVISRALGKF